MSMEREIKFRAWYKPAGEEGRMIEVNQLNFNPNIEGTIVNDLPRQKYIKALMQYTGLKDKNGREIYEGDIIAAKFRHEYIDRVRWDGPPDIVGEVFWDFNGFRLKAVGEKDRRFASFDEIQDSKYFNEMLQMNRSQSEVIGNIYENPGLLEAA